MNKTKAKIDRSVYDNAADVKNKYIAKPGLTEDVVREISRQKNEPEWMLEKRLKAFELFKKAKTPTWGPSLEELDLDKIIYYIRPDAQEARTWDDVPKEIRDTFEKLGIPEAEREALAGVGAQYDSDIIYHSLKKEWKEKGVIFENMDVAVREHPELVKKYFMTECIPIHDHKFIIRSLS